MIILQIDGGGLIFSVLTVLSFLIGLFYWANNRAINEMKDEMAHLREQIRALLNERGAGTRIIPADEIESALKSYQISPTAAFIAVDVGTEKGIEKTDRRAAHLQGGIHFETYIPPFDAGAGFVQIIPPPIWEQNQSESGKEFAKGNRQPITEVLSEIYDEESDGKSNN